MQLILKTRQRLPWFKKDRIVVVLKEANKKNNNFYTHRYFDWLTKIFHLVVKFYKLARRLDDTKILGGLCAEMEARLAKEQELNDKYHLLQHHEGFTAKGKIVYIARCDNLLGELGYYQ